MANESKKTMLEFFKETKREVDKVTWPSRKEIYVTTALIIAFAIIMGIFFLAVDGVLGYVISKILGMS